MFVNIYVYFMGASEEKYLKCGNFFKEHEKKCPLFKFKTFPRVKS